MVGNSKSKSTGRKPRLSDAQVAAHLSGETGVMAFRRLADGSLAVVNGRGQKQVYSAAAVCACRKEAGDGKG